MGIMASLSPITPPARVATNAVMQHVPDQARSSDNDSTRGTESEARSRAEADEVKDGHRDQEVSPHQDANMAKALTSIEREEMNEQVAADNVDGALESENMIQPEADRLSGLLVERAFDAYRKGETKVLGWEVALAALARGERPTPSCYLNEVKDMPIPETVAGAKIEVVGDNQQELPEPSTANPPKSSPAVPSSFPNEAIVNSAEAVESPTHSSPCILHQVASKKRRRPIPVQTSAPSLAALLPQVTHEQLSHDGGTSGPGLPHPSAVLPIAFPFQDGLQQSFHLPAAPRTARAGVTLPGLLPWVTKVVIDDPLPECEQDGCTEQASFGLKGSEHVNRCPRHYTGRMIDLLIRRCPMERCERYPPVFGFPGQMGSSLVCQFHRKAGMLDLSESLCQRKGCRERPGEAAAAYLPVRSGGSMDNAIDSDATRRRQATSLFCDKHFPDGRLRVVSGTAAPYHVSGIRNPPAYASSSRSALVGNAHETWSTFNNGVPPMRCDAPKVPRFSYPPGQRLAMSGRVGISDPGWGAASSPEQSRWTEVRRAEEVEWATMAATRSAGETNWAATTRTGQWAAAGSASEFGWRTASGTSEARWAMPSGTRKTGWRTAGSTHEAERGTVARQPRP